MPYFCPILFRNQILNSSQILLYNHPHYNHHLHLASYSFLPRPIELRLCLSSFLPCTVISGLQDRVAPGTHPLILYSLFLQLLCAPAPLHPPTPLPDLYIKQLGRRAGRHLSFHDLYLSVPSLKIHVYAQGRQYRIYKSNC